MRTWFLPATGMVATLAAAGASALPSKHPAPPSARAAGGGDATVGEAVFKRCVACHRVGPGAANGLGPALNGIVGRPGARVPNFRYSPAMTGAKPTWNREALSRFLAAPRNAMPGTRMAFGGLPNAKDREDVIAYLAQFGPNGAKKK